MVSVDEATAIILSHLYKPVAECVPLSDGVGRVLAQKIYADRDFPPFDRVSMDGIALQHAVWQQGRTQFDVEGLQAAGMEQKQLIDFNHCMEVMTGATLPLGTDTVVRYEDLQLKDNTACIQIDASDKGKNIHPKGSDAKSGSLLLEPGIILSPAEIALLASVGKSNVEVFSFPAAAIISTGDELVNVNEKPEAHQIRSSNTHALTAAMRQLQWNAQQFHVPDGKEILLKSLKQIITNHQVLIISGGVSKGKFDFIPEVLESLEVKKLFHQVSQRPGKPFWFGVSEKGKIVFALPGNPVSTYMCFYRFIKPWLLKSIGVEQATAQAILATDFSFTPSLTYFLQVSIKNEQGKLMAYPVAGAGSGDFANLKNVDGFLELPIGKNKFEAGEVYSLIAFR